MDNLSHLSLLADMLNSTLHRGCGPGGPPCTLNPLNQLTPNIWITEFSKQLESRPHPLSIDPWRYLMVLWKMVWQSLKELKIE